MIDMYQPGTGPDKKQSDGGWTLNNKCELDGSEEEVEVSKDRLEVCARDK